jgi:hypothetical protein
MVVVVITANFMEQMVPGSVVILARANLRL